MLVNLLTDAFPALTIAVRPPGHTTPERLLGEGPERSLGAALQRDIAWRAVATAGSTWVAWSLARPFTAPRRASTVALLTLVGTQLGQTVWLGWRNPPVVWAAVSSGVVLFLFVQTPGVSALAGSTPLGPIGLAHAGLCAGGGIVLAGVLPKVWAAADARFGMEQQVAKVASSEVGRWILESRWVAKLRMELPKRPTDPEGSKTGERAPPSFERNVPNEATPSPAPE